MPFVKVQVDVKKVPRTDGENTWYDEEPVFEDVWEYGPMEGLRSHGDLDWKKLRRHPNRAIRRAAGSHLNSGNQCGRRTKSAIGTWKNGGAARAGAEAPRRGAAVLGTGKPGGA